MKNIAALRTRIDQLDDIIMDALDQRFSLTKKIGEIKKQSDFPVYQSDRESVIFDKLKSTTHHEYITAVYEMILTQSKAQQKE